MRLLFAITKKIESCIRNNQDALVVYGKFLLGTAFVRFSDFDKCLTVWKRFTKCHCVGVFFKLVMPILFQRLFIPSGTPEHPQKSRIVQSDWYQRQNFVWTQFSKYHRHGNSGPMLGQMLRGL